MGDLEDGFAKALQGVLADHGRRVTENPARVRALLSDAMGAQARERRGEIDALVLATEEQVPATITDTGTSNDVDAMVRALEARGLTAEMAMFAVHAWRDALVAGPAPSSDGTDTSWSRPGGSPHGRPGLEPLGETEIPLDAPPPGRAVPTAVSTTTTPPLASGPRLISMPRGRVAAIGALSLAGAFALGVAGARTLEPAEPALAAAAATTTPTTTQTVTNTTTTTTTVTKAPKTVTRTVVVNPTKLRALSDTVTITTYISWSGSKSCSLKRPAKPTAVYPCYNWFPAQASGSVKSWKVVAAKVVSGSGTASVDGKKVNFNYTHNGPYTSKIRFVIEGGGVQSTATLTVHVSCNRNFGCGKPMPT